MHWRRASAAAHRPQPAACAILTLQAQSRRPTMDPRTSSSPYGVATFGSTDSRPKTKPTYGLPTS
ncbi:hypothetical protein PF008_g8940 [Phytophthora fragariae]|uniref:Uncharacterized protein n=1 Tax=Phytophthora fragariae TaxID=53985 RepID=A0A6G0RY55_9STRA|nr:hypothetical protein PF008_g8940 [Phytophthora fragariae]